MAPRSFDSSDDRDQASPAVAPEVMPQRSVEPAGLDRRSRLDLPPEPFAASSLRNRKRWVAAAAAATIVIHAAFAAFFLFLLDFRNLPDVPEKAIPVEIVTAMPEVPKPPVKSEPPPGPPPPSAAAAEPARSEAPPPPPFVAPPPEAMPAQSQKTESEPANTSHQPPASDPARTPPAPAPAPTVLSAHEGTFTVAAPAPDTEKPPAGAGDAARATASAKLAEALPMDLSAFPSTFRSVLSGGGAKASLEYKGLVYGRIQRSHRAMEEARTRHLQGQVIVSFSVDDQGRATDLRIAGSSGTPALDALGLAMVREAEPFPPPPPGAKQVFTPAFAVGTE